MPATETAREMGEEPAGTAGFSFPSSLQFRWGMAILFAYFGVRLLFFALSVSPSIPPDEVTHFGISEVFSRVPFLPENSPETYRFGLVTNTPWLYYWLMGKLLRLDFFGMNPLLFLRILNIPLAFGTVFFAWRTLRLLTEDRLAQMLLVTVTTNLLMFSFLSASVSYDNLTNLFAAMALYYLLAFFRKGSAGLLATSLICQTAGSLTKVTFLPLVLVLNLLLVVHLFRNRELVRGFPAWLREGAGRWVTLLVLLAGLGLNLQLYGGNLARFGTLTPGMQQVLSPELGMQHRLTARSTIFNQYREGKLSYMDAIGMTSSIGHPGDRADTLFLLMNYEKLKANPGLWMGPLEYAEYWLKTMLLTIFGIKAHLLMPNTFAYLPALLLLALALAGVFLRRIPSAGLLPLCMAAVVLFHTGMLYQLNYDTYLHYGTPGLTLQGRYLFPVLAPVAVLFSFYFLRLFRHGHLRVAAAAAAGLFFIACDLPFFLLQSTPQWFEWPK